MIINLVNLKEDSPQKIFDAFSLSSDQSVRMIGDKAPSHFHSQRRQSASSLMPNFVWQMTPFHWVLFETHEQKRKKAAHGPHGTITVPGRDFS